MSAMIHSTALVLGMDDDTTLTRHQVVHSLQLFTNIASSHIERSNLKFHCSEGISLTRTSDNGRALSTGHYMTTSALSSFALKVTNV